MKEISGDLLLSQKFFKNLVRDRIDQTEVDGRETGLEAA